MRKAIILAAGINSRLSTVVKDIPKCLLKIGNTTIIDYQIELLTKIANLKFQDIFIIGGHKIEKLNYLKDLGVNVVFNPKYKEFNNIYSFYLAKNFVTEDFILLNGDTLAHRRIMELLVNSKYKTAFVVDNVKKLGQEEMKVLIENNRIVKFGKDIDPKIAQGEYIGYAKFSIEDALVIFDCMEKLIKEGKTSIWYENAINYVLEKIKPIPVYTEGLPWIEIDTPEDYKRAKEMEKQIFCDLRCEG